MSRQPVTSSGSAAGTAPRADRLHCLGDALLEAAASGEPIAPPRQLLEGMDLDDAYRVQTHQLTRHIEEGRQLAGRKIGLTSLAMQAQLGVDSPDFGFFFKDMVFAAGDRIPTSSFISPRVEPELGLVLGHTLRGPGVTIEQAREAVDTVLPALEIIDSRVRDWDITLVDTVADNASCGAIVLSETPVDAPLKALAEIPCALRIDDAIVEEGQGTAVMGDPVEPLVWLANVLGERGEAIAAGHVVLTGSFTKAVPVVAGQTVTADFGRYGSLTIDFT